MVRFFAAVTALALLPACSHLPELPSFAFLKREQVEPAAAVYHFDWELSGNRAVAPLQVFDDGRRTWLQFAPQQAVPAIFGHGAEDGAPLGRAPLSRAPLAYAHEGPYVVLPGVWPRLVLRGGGRESILRRLAPAGQGGSGGEAGKAAAVSAADAPVADASAVGTSAMGASAVDASTAGMPAVGALVAGASAAVSAVNASAVDTPAVAIAAEAIPAASAVPASLAAQAPAAVDRAPALATAPVPVPAPDADAIAQLTAVSFQSGMAHPDAAGDPVERYEVSPADQTLRAALDRWARVAGWTFQPEHWAVDADIPIVGSARFEQPFKLAVRELVASTEMADRPLQPCFYSNRVLRIVPYAQRCDRGAGAARSS